MFYNLDPVWLLNHSVIENYFHFTDEKTKTEILPKGFMTEQGFDCAN